MLEAKSVEGALSLIENDKSKVLGLTIGGHIITPGQEIPKEDAQVPPSLAFAVPENTYIAIALDIDAPFPSFGVLGPILHWIQPGLVPSPSSTQLTTTSPFVVDYIGPAPPPGSASHRYIFLLYEQPKDFDSEKYTPPGGQKFGLWKRVRYDLGTFEKETGLGKVLAANYFLSK